MAVVNRADRLSPIDGAEGHLTESDVFKISGIGQALENGSLDLPKTGRLPGRSSIGSCVLIGGEDFRLRKGSAPIIRERPN